MVTRSNSIHVDPPSPADRVAHTAAIVDITCTVPSGATATHGRSTRRTLESDVQRHVAPTSWLTPIAISVPCPTLRSKAIEAK